jgi:hypothetical protein
MGVLKSIPITLRRAAKPVLCGRAVAAMAAVACAIFALCASAQSDLAEYEIKAAFLFNFTKFVEWPAISFSDAKAPIILGIIGKDPFGPSLDGIVDGQIVQGRGIVVRRERPGEYLRSCQILFIDDSERAQMPQILASLQGLSVLTVSDIEGFAEAGGVVQFVIEDSRVRFVINLEAASRAKLRINSKLLALARVINRAAP